MNRPTPSLIYFMKPIGMDGPIKIGCSNMPLNRLEQLSMWSPFPLEVVASAAGGYDVETKLHRRFSFAHSHREWFHANPALLAAIKAVAAGASIEEAVDLSVSFGSIRTATGPGSRPECEVMKGYRSYSMKVTWAQKKLRDLDEDGAWKAPEDVTGILRRWFGHAAFGIARQRPNADEFRRLDEFLANPAEHSVFSAWRRAKVAA